MTDTKLIAREPTEKMVRAAANAYLTCMSGDVASDMRMALIAAFDAAPGYCYRSPAAPAPAPSEPTLRQRYAMAAMQGLLASDAGTVPSEETDGLPWSDWRNLKYTGERAFAIADAMIAAEGER